jgi:1,4-alpha-glucan branching enzyme
MSKMAPVEITLFAPYNEAVALVADWNNWKPAPMKKDAGGCWRITANLPDGDYLYKFAVKSKSWFALDQTVSVSDPYGTEITLDADENTRLKVRGGKRVVSEYQWKYDNVPLPQNDKLVIYEVYVGDFSGGLGDEPGKGKRKGKFKHVTEKLDYLAGLGINAVELMPCQEFPGEQSWGYNPRSLFAIENSYGGVDELCQLVDECHKRGIRFIMDGVYNHSESEAPFTKINFEYWYWRENPDPPELQFGPKWNYSHYDENLKIWPARQYVLDSINYWIDIFHIDGIRFDATRAVGSFDFLAQIHDFAFQKLNGVKPFYTIAEHIPQDPAITKPAGPLDSAWHDNFYHVMRAMLMGSSTSIADVMRVLDPNGEGFASAYNVINYLETHDKDRILWDLGKTAGIIGAPAFRRMKLGAALLLTGAGIPMLWMGQEFGQAAEKTLERRPIDWALLQNQDNGDLMRYYSGLINLRKNTPALQNDTLEPILVEEERGLLAYKRWTDAGGVVIVVANLRDQYAGEFVITNAGIEDGTWHEYHYNYDTSVQGGVLKDSLAESEVKIFIKQ